MTTDSKSNSEDPEVKPDQDDDLKVISATRIDTYIRCGMQYYYREVEGVKSPPGIALHIGIATHEAGEVDLRHKMEHGTLMKDDEVADAARDAFANSTALEGVEFSPEEKSKQKKTLGEAVDQSVKCAIEYHTQVSPGVEPIAIERPWGMKLNDRWRMTGHIDIQEAHRIRDIKTQKNSPKPVDKGGEMKGSHLDQLLTYATGVYVNDKKIVEEAVVDVVPKLKKKEGKVVTYSVKPTRDALVKRIDRAEMVTRAIDQGVFLPADPDHWICSEKFCGYWDRCPFGRAKRVMG